MIVIASCRLQYFVMIESIGITYRPQFAMTLTELKYLVAVAAERHFGRAAERSFVSQPSLSAAIKNLEDELGVRIFERGKGDILVTPIGEQLVAQAKRVLEEAERVKTIAKQGKQPLQGEFRLGVIHTVAPYLLPDLVAELRKRAPDMPLDIEENMTANLEQMLKNGGIDAAILALPLSVAGVTSLPLYNEAFRAIVPAKHPWARRKAVTVDELADENLLLLSAGHCFRDQVLDACREFSRAPTAGKQGNSLETLRSMVASGMGVSVLPAMALTGHHANPLVKAIDFVAPAPTRRIGIVYRTGFPRTTAVQAIANAVQKLRLPVEPIGVTS